MLGLLQKDLYTLKKQGKIMFIILLVYMIFGYLNNNPTFFLVFLLVFSAMMPLTAMAYDEKNQCDKLFLCMPLTRRDLVSSRFLLGLLLILGSFSIGIISILLLIKEDRMEAIFLLGTLLGVCFLYFSICFPIALTFGVEKSRYTMLGLIFIPTIVTALFATKGYLNPVLNFFKQNTTMKGISTLSILIGFVFYLISYFFSMQLYENREL
ncbi:MAG: ABC-2 transporter permease [Velocimicrobium sp.]